MGKVRFTAVLFAASLSQLSAGDDTDPRSERDKQWRQQIADIAKNYELFGRVDHLARWAPELCRIPNPPIARMSQSDDAVTHGKKLYSLFAKNRDAYTRDRVVKYRDLKEAPVGQWIVKEAWTPEVVAGDPDLKPVVRKLKEKDHDGQAITDVFVPYGKHDGKYYKAKERSGLFIMLKLDASTPDTDQGWVYATVAKDLKTVTALGKIESCMNCHQKAKFDRQFGLNKGASEWPLK